MDYDEFYCIKSSLQNLKMLKLAFDYGLDVSKYKDFHLYQGTMSNWNVYEMFISIISDIFEIVEQFEPYDEDEEEKRYWMKETYREYVDTNFLEYLGLDSNGVIVILDDRLTQRSIPCGVIDSGSTNDFYYGFTELLSIEDGLVIHYNEDEGEPDWVEVLCVLIELMGSEQTNEVEV